MNTCRCGRRISSTFLCCFCYQSFDPYKDEPEPLLDSEDDELSAEELIKQELTREDE